LRLLIPTSPETLPDKGKPVARRGRKAAGEARRLTTGLPKEGRQCALVGNNTAPPGKSPMSRVQCHRITGPLSVLLLLAVPAPWLAAASADDTRLTTGSRLLYAPTTPEI
jgi:hypothetical protein